MKSGFKTAAVAAVALWGCGGDDGGDNGAGAAQSKPDVPMYSVTVSSAGSNSMGGGRYEGGATVYIESGTPPAGYAFNVWTTSSVGVIFNNPNDATTRFVMPRNDVTVTANFLPTGETPGGGGNNVSQTVNGYTFEMVPVAGGTFTMGCTAEQGSACWDNEKPAHSVTLSGYYIGKYEVTQGLWKAVMGVNNNPSYFTGSDNLPVETVSWNQVKVFIDSLNRKTGKTYRLPTEAEWEYAARGGNKSGGYKYSGSNTLGSVAWYGDNSGSKTHEVGTKSPNELGIYDMSGNVWEWVGDWYASYTEGSQTNPTGPTTGSNRVNRGGGWSNGGRDCRVSIRDYYGPDNSGDYLGFRLVLLSP